MILHPVLIEIPPAEGLTGPQRVERQREYARMALSRCAELSDVPNGPWEKSPEGVPIPCGRLHWSIAHKPGGAAAVIADVPVGIDIERTDPRRADLFEAVADDAEWRIAGGRTWPAFFRVWTAKEAALKANGVGIGHFRECRVLSTADGPCALEFRGQEWRIEHYVCADHLAAVTIVGNAVQWHIG